MNELLLLPLVGAGVSVLVQLIKGLGNKGPRWLTLLLVIICSMVAGGVYTAFRDSNVWQVSLQVLLYANAVYSFVIKYFEA